MGRRQRRKGEKNYVIIHKIGIACTQPYTRRQQCGHPCASRARVATSVPPAERSRSIAPVWPSTERRMWYARGKRRGARGGRGGNNSRLISFFCRTYTIRSAKAPCRATLPCGHPIRKFLEVQLEATRTQIDVVCQQAGGVARANWYSPSSLPLFSLILVSPLISRPLADAFEEFSHDLKSAKTHLEVEVESRKTSDRENEAPEAAEPHVLGSSASWPSCEKYNEGVTIPYAPTSRGMHTPSLAYLSFSP